MLALIGGTLLLIISAVGLWVQWFILSENGFVDLTGSVLSREDIREAISLAVIDRLLADFPVLRALVRDPLEAVVSALLGSSLFLSALERVATRIWETLFINGGQVIINLEPLQNFLYGVISAIAPDRAQELSAAQMPDELILLDAGELPDMDQISSIVTWITWLTLGAGLGLSTLVIARVWNQPLVRYGLLAWAGILLIVEAVIVAILSIPTRSTVILAIEGPTGRKVAGTTFDLLVQRLFGILLVVGLIGAVLVATGLWKRHAITRVERAPEATVTEPIMPGPRPQIAGID